MEIDRRKRTLILSVVFSALGPVATGVALTMNTSMTQFADFLRRSVELGVLVMALVVYVKLQNPSIAQAEDDRLQRLMYRASGAVLFFSSVVLGGLFVINVLRPGIPEGNVLLGLFVATLGLLFNAGFFIRYKLFDREKRHAIMDTQGKIYQAKTVVDLNVVIALSTIVFFPASTASYVVDVTGTAIIAVYMGIRGVLVFRKGRSSRST